MIELVSVKDYQYIYIRSLRYNDEFVKTVKAAMKADKLIDPEKHDLVLAPFEKDYYRAIVLSSLENEVKVAFIDYGNVVGVPKSDIKILPNELTQYRRHAMRVMLKFSCDIDEDDSALLLDQLSRWIYHEFKVNSDNNGEIFKDNSITLLFPGETVKSLNETLEAATIKNRFMYDMVTKRQFNVENVKVFLTHVDPVDHTKLSCVLMNEFDNWRQEIKYISQMGSNVFINAPVYKPRINELCFVFMEKENRNLWFRAQAVSWNGNNLTARLIDIGSMEKIKSTNVRKLSADFLNDVNVFDCIVNRPIHDVTKLAELARAKANRISILIRDSEYPIHQIEFDWDSFVVRQQR